jgi:hypothetical protein
MISFLVFLSPPKNMSVPADSSETQEHIFRSHAPSHPTRIIFIGTAAESLKYGKLILTFLP